MIWEDQVIFPLGYIVDFEKAKINHNPLDDLHEYVTKNEKGSDFKCDLVSFEAEIKYRSPQITRKWTGEYNENGTRIFRQREDHELIPQYVTGSQISKKVLKRFNPPIF